MSGERRLVGIAILVSLLVLLIPFPGLKVVVLVLLAVGLLVAVLTRSPDA